MMTLEYIGRKGTSNRERYVRSFIETSLRETDNVREFRTMFLNYLKDLSASDKAHNKQAELFFSFQKTPNETTIDNEDFSTITEGYVVYSGSRNFRVIARISNN